MQLPSQKVPATSPGSLLQPSVQHGYFQFWHFSSHSWVVLTLPTFQHNYVIWSHWPEPALHFSCFLSGYFWVGHHRKHWKGSLLHLETSSDSHWPRHSCFSMSMAAQYDKTLDINSMVPLQPSLSASLVQGTPSQIPNQGHSLSLHQEEYRY